MISYLYCLYVNLKNKAARLFEWQLSLFESTRRTATQDMKTMVNHRQIKGDKKEVRQALASYA